MKTPFRLLTLLLLNIGTLTLYGCGGGGGNTLSSNPDAILKTPAPATMTVTPSLGRFSTGTMVRLTKLDGAPLSSGSVEANGSVVLSLANYTIGPILVTVVGGSGVTYFDEGTDSLIPFGSTSSLQAVLPASQATVGVTALTHAATAMLAAESGDLSLATTTSIKTANYKLAVAFGLPDILQAPNPVGAVTSVAADKLDLAKPADHYALVLAAFAKTSTSGNAAQKSIALAKDMKDGVLDRKDATSATPTAILSDAVTSAAMTTAYQAAATTFATPASQTLAANAPLTIITNVSAVVVKPYQSDIGLAKAMFAELRTTLSSFSNGSSGFLDTEAVRMQADVDASVPPALSIVQDRIMALTDATKAFQAANAYTLAATQGFSATPAFTINGAAHPAALLRDSGSIAAVLNGSGTYDRCWTATTAAPGLQGGTITCAHAGPSSAYWVSGGTPILKMMVYELTANGSDQYTYQAKRYNLATRLESGIYKLGDVTTVPDLPTGTGTLSTWVNEVSFSGTFPPSAYSPSTGLPTAGMDTVTIAATRTALSAANTYRYALSGSVYASQLSGASKAMGLSLDSGSYIATDETERAATGTIKPLGIKVVGTAKTSATKASGSFDLTAFVGDKSGTLTPTSLTFEGSLSDIRSTVAEADRLVLAGKIAATVTGLENYDPRLPKSNANYFRPSLTFTGTVQGPARPLLKLVLTVAESGYSPAGNVIGAVGVDYSYGLIHITGSGIGTGDSNANAMTLRNQDGVAIATNTGLVTKAGNVLATIANGTVNYADGTSESFK